MSKFRVCLNIGFTYLTDISSEGLLRAKHQCEHVQENNWSMDALEALQQRTSAAKLTGDVPAPKVLDNLFKAALRAPDHGLLKPWRFLTISGAARLALGDLFVKAQLADDPDMTAAQCQRAREKPLRAPLIIVVVAVITADSNVPKVEQLLSAGAAAQNILLAAFALGLGAIWRTGAMAYHQVVREGLELQAHEQIVGYLYLGERQGKPRLLPSVSVSEFVSAWPGKREDQ